MTILEVLEAHTVKRPWSEASRMRCKCGEVVIAETEGQLYSLHRAHLAEVLDKHMQEREAAVLLKARDRMAKHWPLALDEFEAGEVCDWLEHEADKIKEAPNGR
ncbi:hypothetical protein ACT17S_11360 [Glutamicibacter mysorens]